MGGARWWCKPDENLTKPEDFRGEEDRDAATGQIRRDIACRRGWRRGVEDQPTGRGGAGAANGEPEPTGGFQDEKIDAAWTVEPWVSHWSWKAAERRWCGTRSRTITVLISGVKFWRSIRTSRRKFVAAHRELTPVDRAKSGGGAKAGAGRIGGGDQGEDRAGV